MKKFSVFVFAFFLFYIALGFKGVLCGHECNHLDRGAKPRFEPFPIVDGELQKCWLAEDLVECGRYAKGDWR